MWLKSLEDDLRADHCANQTTLRVALLVEDGFDLRAVREVFDAALEVPGVRVVGVCWLRVPRRNGRIERMFSRLEHLEKLRAGASGPGRIAFTGVDVPELHGLVFNLDDDVLVVSQTESNEFVGAGHARESKGSRAWPAPTKPDALQQLCDLKLDVILCAALNPLRLPAECARYGAWGIEVGYGVSAFSAAAGAAEVAANSPFTVSRLMNYASPVAKEFYVASIATVLTSAYRTRQLAIQPAIAALRRRLSLLLADSAAANSPLVPTLPRLLPLPSNYPQQTEPSMYLLGRSCLQMGSAWLRKQLQRGNNTHWHIAYAFAEAPLPAIPFHRLRYLAPAQGTFWADPFALVHQGRHYILFEELPYDREVGRLLAVEVFEDREASAPAVVLQRNYHLSYPHAFHWQGQLYMVPETKSAGRVELLRCIEFPSRWELSKVLIDGVRAVDATLWQQDAHWWMFLNVAPAGTDAAGELHLYHSESLLGDWTPHPGNPQCADIRCARPAGPLFVANGELFRPSQDSALRYGHALWLNRVERLDPRGFEEQPVRRIEPDWHPDVRCVHTLGRSGRLTVLDCVLDRNDRVKVQREYAVPFDSSQDVELEPAMQFS